MRKSLAASLALVVIAALAGPAAAAGPTPAVDAPSVSVATVGTPFGWAGHAGAFDCDTDSPTPTAGILWIDWSKGRARLWTDLKFSEGRVTKSSSGFQVPWRGAARAGDFDGDGCTDLIAFSRTGYKPRIWWGGPQGLKSASARWPELQGKTRPLAVRLSGGRDSLMMPDEVSRPRLWIATGDRARPFKKGKVGAWTRGKIWSDLASFTDLVNGEARIMYEPRPTNLGSNVHAVTALTMKGATLERGQTTRFKAGPTVLARSYGCGSRAFIDLPGIARDREIWAEGGGVAQSRPVELRGWAQTSGSGAALPGGGCVLVRAGQSLKGTEIRVIPPPAAPALPGGDTGVPEAHPKSYLNASNRARLAGLLAGNDAAAVRFRSMVDSEVGGTDHYGFEPWFAALMGQLTGDPKYCALAVERTEAWVTGEEALINAGQRAEVAGDSYLEVGGHIGSLAMTFDWCYASLSASQRTRWINYANQAVWNVWHHEDATWGGVAYPWSGWSVDNPSNNYYYSFLRATMLLGLATEQENPLAAGWLTKFRQEKIGMQLIPTFNSDLNGGGSREGTGYGTAMKGLWELYDIWESSTGERISDLTPHTKASIPYLMHETVPSLDRIAPIGDHARDSTAALFDYHREYALKLAWLYRDDPIAAPLRGWLAANSVPQMSQYFEYVQDFLYRDPTAQTSPLSSLNTTYFSPGAADLFARSSWNTNATWMAMRMGPYTESHAHHDQLSLLVNRNGWLAYDPNIDSHSGLVQDDEAHNLVRIEHSGTVRRQREGYSSTVQALADNSNFTYAAADATALYNPADVNRVQRELVYLKPNVIVVYDRVNAGTGATLTWQLNSPFNPAISPGLAAFGSPVEMRVRSVKPSSATQSAFSWETYDSAEFSGGFRYDITQTGSGDMNFLNVIELGDSVSTLTAADAAGADGVQLTLTSGGTATVQFPRTGTGGHLTLTGAAGSFDGALPSGIQSLPLFTP